MQERSSGDLLVEAKGAVCTITLHRPDRLNAISLEMITALGEVLAEADRDPEVRVLVLTGAGRGFCSGLDLKDAASGRGIGGAGMLSPGGGAAHISTREIPTVTLHQIDKPVLCAINGAAAGYGLDLALGCDIRLMSDRAKLLPGFAKRGIVPESGGTWFLPRLVGWARACEIGFLAEDLSPERAAELGLVNRVVPHDELLPETMRWAERIAANAPLGVQAMKRLYRHGLSEDFESHTHHVLMQLLLLFRSLDFQEGVKSFLERRPPVFQGK
jgi:enoyl-CoA hydratase/carnithine racemase